MSLKILHFARTYFREWAVLQFFARIYFRESAMLRIFMNINFHESAILRYFTSTYIWESTVFSFSRILIFANRASSNFSRGLSLTNLTKIREIRENLSLRKLILAKINPIKVYFGDRKCLVFIASLYKLKLRICLVISNWSQTHDDRLVMNLLLILNAANLHHL